MFTEWFTMCKFQLIVVFVTLVTSFAIADSDKHKNIGLLHPSQLVTSTKHPNTTVENSNTTVPVITAPVTTAPVNRSKNDEQGDNDDYYYDINFSDIYDYLMAILDDLVNFTY